MKHIVTSLSTRRVESARIYGMSMIQTRRDLSDFLINMLIQDYNTKTFAAEMLVEITFTSNELSHPL